MRRLTLVMVLGSVLTGLVLAASCGGDNEANQQLIGADCAVTQDCDDGDAGTPAVDCVLDFKGGYCGRKGCTASADCPAGSLCAVLEGANYCFLTCIDKPDCNSHRSVNSESNCSSSVKSVEETLDKLCIPPSA